MKILLVGDHRVMETEHLFREKLINNPNLDVSVFGWDYSNEEILEGRTLSDKIEFLGGVDVVLLSFYWKLPWYKCINKAKALKVSIAPDFYEGAYRIVAYEKLYRLIDFDVVTGYGTIVMNYLKKMGVGKKRRYLPFGVDTEFFKKSGVEKPIDVCAAFTTRTIIPDVYPYRLRIQKLLVEMPMVVFTGKTAFSNMPKLTNRSKIVVNCNAKYNFLTPRVTETMACGTFLLTSYCDDLAKFGYKDEEHLVTFHNMDDFKDKVKYFLKNDKEREEIAENGMNFVRENYSNEKRIDIFVNIVEKYL